MITEEIAEMAELIKEKCSLSLLRSIGIAELIHNANYRIVERGEWKKVNTPFGRPIYYECSVCGYEAHDVSNGNTNYCPNCGADMRGDENVVCAD